MFLRIFIYKLKELSRKYWLVGWNFAFPLVLATAFALGFGNFIKDAPENLKTIETGYVKEAKESAGFDTVLEEISKESNDGAAIIALSEYSEKDDAIQAMNEGRIEGFFLETEDGIETIVPTNGFSATILNEIVRQYNNYANVVTKIAEDHPEKIKDAMEALSENYAIATEHSFGSDTSQYLQYFFALLAMASLFSSWISTHTLEGICANMSEQGKRVECAPTPKFTSIAAGILAGFLLQLVSNIILALYIQYILKIDLGLPISSLVLLCSVGSAAGISFGTLMGSILKEEKLLMVIPLVFSMICSFFSGLMWGNIKQIIQYHCPIVNRINPAALLTDAMYVRSTYGATDVYRQDIAIMCIMVAGCLILSSMFLRRRRYVSL